MLKFLYIVLYTYSTLNVDSLLINYDIGKKYGINTNNHTSTFMNGNLMYSYIYKSAMEGNKDSLYLVGLMLYYGEGIKIDKSQSIIYFRRAAINDHVDAQFAMGLCYINGEGTHYNEKEALYWFNKALSNGHSDALWVAAKMYNEGRGTNINHKIAFELLTKSSKLNNAYAKFYLGIMYEYGLGCKQNFKKSHDLYVDVTNGIKQNKIYQAPYYLGLMYTYARSNVINIDYDKAINYFHQSAMYNYAPAMNMLGKMYIFGKGVKIDYMKALYWYDKAILLNDSTIKNEATKSKSEIMKYLSQVKKDLSTNPYGVEVIL